MHPEDLEIGTLDDSLWPMLFCNFMELITAFLFLLAWLPAP